MKGGAVVAVVGLVLAGCGGDDGGERSASTEPPTTTVSTTTTAPSAGPDEVAAAVCAARPVPGAVRLAEAELAELSGLVHLDSGFWAHNDSGDEARLFRLDDQGATQAVVHLEGVEAQDWEDLAHAGPGSGELFAGDIGDNESVRDEVLVHRVTVPDPAPSGETSIPADEVDTITLRYPDGARDAEALLVDPVTRDLLIVHKRFGGASELYQATEDDWSDGEATLEQVGTVEVGATPVDAATAADIGFDGRVIAVRTYAAVLVFPRHEGQSLAEALAENEPCDAPTAVEVQGEALAFTPDGYVTISEGDRPLINRFAVTLEG